MRATIRQVAERAGVSAMTVSRVLRGQGPSASPATVERVLQAARELNYIAVRPILQNQNARTQVIGVVFDGIVSLKSLVGANTFEGLRDAALQRGYDLLIHAPRPDVLQRQEAAFLDRRTDGVIFVSPRQRRSLLRVLVGHGFPVVSCYSNDVPRGVATITPDNALAMSQIVAHLVARGHRKIGFFSGPHWHSDARERRAAWTEAMCGHGLAACADWIEDSEGDSEHHCRAARRLLDRKPTAVVCHNDYRALTLWDAARERGLKVPRDLSISGMDDIPEAKARGLTTFATPFEQAGRACVDAVDSLVEGRLAAEVSQRLAVGFVERTSIGDVADAKHKVPKSKIKDKKRRP